MAYMTKTATLIGSTGMIGSYLLDLLREDKSFDEIRLIVRRPVPNDDPRVAIKLVDFTDPESFKLAIEGSEAVFCTVGTTQKKVKGDKILYRQIDYDIPVNAARFGKETGCEKFLLVSSVGANSKSRPFYLRLKGEVEDTIASYNIRSVHIMQPSMLLGHRAEKRRMEKILQNFMFFVSTYFFGGWRKYKAIHAGKVAAAMLNAAKKDEPGFFRYTYDGIIQLADVTTSNN
jgi:uncharacterized protein YbjT (DUF2867 family)